MFHIVTQMIILLALLSVGYLCKKIGLMNPDLDRGLSKLVLSATLPGMILSSVLNAETLPDTQSLLIAFALGCLAYALMMVVSVGISFLLGVPKGNRGVYRFMMMFGNVGFMGFPVLSAIFGNEGLIYGALFNLPFNFLVFTYGAWLIASDNPVGTVVKFGWRTFVTPANISCTVSIICALLGICNVPVLGEGLETLGNMTTPAALIIVGSNMANLPPRDLAGTPRIWIAGLVKLIVMPLAVWLVFTPFLGGTMMLGIMVVIAAMPVANNGTMLCFQYGGDSKAMAQGTCISTIASIATIPVLVMLLG